MSAARTLVRALLILLWFGICTHLLIVGIAGLRNPEDPANLNSTFVFYQGMRAVGFPLGLVAWYLTYGLVALAGLMNAKPSPEIQMWVMWLAVAGVGYVQWFHLAPWLFRQVMASRKRTRLQLG
jgi:hypothetical protein